MNSNQVSFERFCADNLWRVRHEIRRIIRGPSPETDWRHDDLLSVGMQALWTSFERYKEDAQSKARLLHTIIRRRMLDELRTMAFVPREYFEEARQFQQKLFEMEQRLRRTVSEAEVLRELNWNKTQRRRFAAASASQHVSLDAPDEELTSVLRKLDDGSHRGLFEELDTRDKLAHVQHAIESLPPKLRAVVTALYFEHKSLRQHADEVGVTYQAIQLRRIRAEKLLRMKLQDLRTKETLLK